MLSTWFLRATAETLNRGFGKDVTLTLVEFRNSEMAKNALPMETRSRAIPILSENREVKSIGNLVKELAQRMGKCMYCDNARLHCNKLTLELECRFVNKRKEEVEAIIKSVDRQMTINTAPVAKLLRGRIVPTTTAKLLDRNVAQAVYDMSQNQSEKEEAKEDGEITEEPTTETRDETDGLFGSDSSSVLDACTSASNVEEKEH